MDARRDDEFSYTPTEAAGVLRVSPTRVRQLLQDGELEGQRDEAGHWLIPAVVVHERLERLRRESFLEAVGYDPLSVREMRGLVDDLRGKVEMLRAELHEAHAANRDNRRIIDALTQRIPTLEPPREQTAAHGPPEATESGGEGRERAGATGDAREEDAEQPQKRGFWRRLFGG